jgi:hypothetical protein
MTHTLSFDDIFHELNVDLETDANDWHLNNFYINFEDEIPDNEELNTLTPDHQQRQHQFNSENKRNKNKPDDHHLVFHEIPDYLLISSSSFQVAFFSELRNLFNPMNFEDLQQLNHLTHQMSIIHLHQQLWNRFLKSGTGQFKQRVQLPPSSLLQDNTNLTVSFWPQVVTSVMISKGIINVNNQQNQINQDIYINFIQKYLQQLETKWDECQFQFDTIKNRLQGYYEGLNDKIDHFVRTEGLVAMRLHFQTRIALNEYICLDRSFQLQYFQQNPTHLQVNYIFVHNF